MVRLLGEWWPAKISADTPWYHHHGLDIYPAQTPLPLTDKLAHSSSAAARCIWRGTLGEASSSRGACHTLLGGKTDQAVLVIAWGGVST